MSRNLSVVSTWTAATVWSLWSRSKWWALQLSSPPPPSLLFIPQLPLFLKHKRYGNSFIFLSGSPESNIEPFWIPLTPQVDGVSYLLQEIYGIENKYNSQESKVTGSKRLPACSSCVAASVTKNILLGWFWLFDRVADCRWPMTRSVTTVRSVWCACRTCATHSSCHADTCVSATPAQTRCATRPTAAPSAGCVSSKHSDCDHRLTDQLSNEWMNK